MKYIDLAKHKVLLACVKAFFLLLMKHIDLAKHKVLLPCAKAFFFAFNEIH